MSTDTDTNTTPLLDVHEAARFLGVKVRTMYEWSAAGVVPSLKVGRLLRFRRSDLEAWLDANARGGPAS
jgi:excisionase family DNA binding protein